MSIKTLPTLYSRTSSGSIQSWTIEIEDDKHRVVSGLVDGKKITSNWTVCLPKNIGRSNETTAEQQADLEAQAKWKKKLEADYRLNISDIDQKKFIEPMLAKNFEDYINDIVYPVFSQPKYDGIRCIVNSHSMKSRNGKDIVSAPHILKELQAFFDKFPSISLDGELYCDKLANDFNKICSLVKKAKPTISDINESANTIQYWVYDFVDLEKPFKDRCLFLKDNLPQTSCIKLVPTDIANNFQELTTLYEGYVSNNYEGQMIRLNALYELKRSKHLLKRKEFQDNEFLICDVLEGDGNKSGMAGSMLLVDKEGKTFNSNIKGDRDYLKSLLVAKNYLINKYATVKYFNLTPDGIPRFPYVITIRDYE